MGWTSTHKPTGESSKAFFEREFGCCNFIECATINGVFYAAVENKRDPGKVFGMVVLMKRHPKEYLNFTYKDISEEMGPCECRCPDRVLDKLSPTESEYANQWREACRRYNSKPTPKVGDHIEFDHPVTFTDGHVSREFTVERYGKRAIVYRSLENNRIYRIGDVKRKEFKIVSVAKNSA